MKSNFRTISDVEKFMNSIPMFSQKGLKAVNFNLDRILGFCRIIGDPQKSIKSIHVAGTNGKGTVCRMLASVYQSAGYKTGLYTSPHLVNFRERFRINENMIFESDLVLFFNLYHKYIRNQKYTYFEITTAIAFWYFQKHQVDIAIIETGLGGRLDATNIILPEISVITSIGMDHMDILGKNLESIAREKGGIIKQEIPVIIGVLPSEAQQVILEIADEMKSDVIFSEKNLGEFKNGMLTVKYGDSELDLKGTFLKKIDTINCAIVSEVIKMLNVKFPVNVDDYVSGIESLEKRFPVRGVFENLRTDKQWYFDGAHNDDAVAQLIEHLNQLGDVNKWTVVLSFMKDKLTPEVAQQWIRFPNLKIVSMNTGRSATISEMKQYFQHAEEINLDEITIKNEFETELVIFSGSFYFYSVVSKWLGTILASENNLSALEE